MTALERLNPRQAPIQRSPRSVSARNARVRSNSDISLQDTPLTTQNKSVFHSGADVPATATVALHPRSSLTNHPAPNEIP